MEIIMKKNRCLPVCLAVILIAMFMTPVSLYAKDPLLVIRGDEKKSEKETLLLLRIEGRDFETTVRGFCQEADDEFFIREMVISRDTAVFEVAEKMKEVQPKLVVLMDNISIALYKKYQASSGTSVPSISLMASFTDIAIEGMKNATGIFYEAPIVTSVVNLRAALPSVQFRRVGVVYRQFLEPFVRIHREYCRKEHIELVAQEIPNKSNNLADELKKALETLYEKKNIDALWVMNDSVLVSAELLKNVWIPLAEKFRKPVIAGVEVLVQPKFDFGTFAVIPDHAELGSQAMEMVYNIRKNQWQVVSGTVEQPRSVYKILNLKQAQQIAGSAQLNFVDKVLN